MASGYKVLSLDVNLMKLASNATIASNSKTLSNKILQNHHPFMMHLVSCVSKKTKKQK